jgi:hypothetical protein
MSGPLRRTQRSRPADAGEPLSEDRAAEQEGAAPTAETPPAQPETAGEGAVPAGGETTTPADAPTPSAEDTTPPADAPTPPSDDATPAAEDATPPAPPETAGEGGVPPSEATTSVDVPTPAAEAATPAEGAAESPSTEPAAAAGAEPDGADEAQEASGAARTKRRLPRWRPFRKGPKTAPPTEATAPAPVLLADPDTPAGVDPAEAPMRPPAGRRGRLRRRLRYLRRARELMLRDLGGLLYEVHRTGGGNVAAHATVIGAKVQRIAGLDAEVRALETALAAPRGETVVFEPGVGGTCETCGALYGSDARFCANCGAPIGTAAAPAVEAKPPTGTEEVVSEPVRRAFWGRAVRPPEATAASAEAAAEPDPAERRPDEPAATPDESSTTGEEPTAVAKPDESAPTGDEPTAVWTRDEAPAADDTAGSPPSEPSPPATEPNAEQAGDDPAAPDEPRNPYSSVQNGRPESDKPPELSPGDPLASRDSRS